MLLVDGYPSAVVPVVGLGSTGLLKQSARGGSSTQPGRAAHPIRPINCQPYADTARVFAQDNIRVADRLRSTRHSDGRQALVTWITR
jgi:hypothetical protein